MIPAVTEDVFTAVMGFIESNDNTEILTVAKGLEQHMMPEIAAQTYVAYLKLTGRDFPKVKKTKYSVTIIDDSPYFAFYRVASCGGIGVKQIKELYDRTILPEMIITQVANPVTEPAPTQEKEVNTDLPQDIAALSKVRGLQWFNVKPGGINMLSSEAKSLRKKGGVITVYKVIYKNKVSFINVIQYKGKTSYDINSFYCKDDDTLVKEFYLRNGK